MTASLDMEHRRAIARVELARRRAARAATFEDAARRDFPALSLPQRAVCRLLDGLPPTDEVAPCRVHHDPAAPLDPLSMAAVYERLLGRPWGEDLRQRRQLAVLVAGRGSAKTLLAASRAKYRALTCPVDGLGPGERAHLPVIAPKMEAARQLLAFVAGFLREQPAHAALLDGKIGVDRVRFSRRTAITLYAADRGGLNVRSKTLADVFVDEAGFFYSASDHAVTDQAVVEAAIYRLGEHGQVLATTSPWTRTGLCFRAHQEQFGRSAADLWRLDGLAFRGVLVLQADAWFLNPAWTLKGEPGTASFDREARGLYVEDDDQGVAAETQVRAAMAGRAGDAAPGPGAVAALDASGGGRHRTGFAVARPDAGRVIISALRSWTRDTPIERRIEDSVDLARAHGAKGADGRPLIYGDQFSFDAIDALVRARGATLVRSPLRGVDAMSLAGELLRSGRASLPSAPPADRLPRQFASITVTAKERGGLDLFVPAEADGGHCDEAVATALAMALAWQQRGSGPRVAHASPRGIEQDDWTDRG